MDIIPKGLSWLKGSNTNTLSLDWRWVEGPGPGPEVGSALHDDDGRGGAAGDHMEATVAESHFRYKISGIKC